MSRNKERKGQFVFGSLELRGNELWPSLNFGLVAGQLGGVSTKFQVGECTEPLDAERK